MESLLGGPDDVDGLMLLWLVILPSSMDILGMGVELGVGVAYSLTCSICFTKLDILDDFDELKVGVAYKINGSLVEGMPGDVGVKERVVTLINNHHTHTQVKVLYKRW